MESTITEINNRQSKIIPDLSGAIAIVAGLGGIGSWVALDLALIGVGSILIYDTDKIEPSNLNRTLFKESQIGQYKTDAVKELIAERRKDCLVLSFEEFFEAEMLNKLDGVEYFFDCTDTTRLKDSMYEFKVKKQMEFEELKKKEEDKNKVKNKSKKNSETSQNNQSNSGAQYANYGPGITNQYPAQSINQIQEYKFPQYVKLGYDGFEGTICLNDFNAGRWGTDSSYTITPSFFGTPQMLSAAAVIEMLIVKNKNAFTKTVNVTTLLTLLHD
ncbi:MAG: ThiF family adenylyltransferase [Bacteroidetes bacterium]|nr:ThiF family adenylyltransferase [Bacteroidota bacterium]